MDQNNFNANDKITLKEIIIRIIEWYKHLLFHWKKIVLAGIVGGLLGLLISFVVKPSYTATMSFALDEEKGMSGGLGGYLGVASQLGIDMGTSGGSVFTGDNIIELMKSRMIIESTLLNKVNISTSNQSLADYYIDQFDIRETLDKKGLKGLSFPADKQRTNFTIIQDSLLFNFYKSIVKNNLSVQKVDKKLSIYVVKFKSSSELFSKYFTESLVDEISRFYTETKTRRAKAIVSLLQNRVDSVKNAYESALYGRAEFADANQNISRQTASVANQKKQTDIQILGTSYGELIKNFETSKLTLSKETPLIQKIDIPILPLEKEKIGKLKGAFWGCFIFTFLSSLYFILKLSLTRLMNE